MNSRSALRQSIFKTIFFAYMLSSTAAHADANTIDASLVGTWTLVAADVLHPDGSRGRDYGADPKGLLVIDERGYYSLQIFKAERPKFASGDKARGTSDEYREAVMGSSTHYGTVSADTVDRILTFHIQNASFPNWQGEEQRRSYEIKGGELSYRVSPRPNGDVPISVWKRLN